MQKESRENFTKNALLFYQCCQMPSQMVIQLRTGKPIRLKMVFKTIENVIFV